MKLSYARKVKLISYLVPIAIIIPSAYIGYRATHYIFAANPPASGIELGVNQPSYSVGQDVIVTISNATKNNVYIVNNCPSEPLSVYRLENNNWVALNVATSTAKCVGEPVDYEIPAEHSIKTDYRYWPTLFNQPGEYRIVANIEFFSRGPSVEFNVSQ